MVSSKSSYPARIKISAHFSNLNLATKLMIAMYSGIFAIFLFLTALMIILSYKNNIEDQKKQGQEFLKSGMNIVREEMQYISGIAVNLGLASDIQAMMIDSNNGRKPAVSSETLSAVSSQKYAASIILYDRTGRVMDYSAIDGSSDPLDQPVDDLQHPLSRILTKSKTFEWQYIEANNDSFMMRDFSPKLCLWQRVQSSKNKNIIGAIVISVDVRKLLDVGPNLGTAYRSIIIANDKNEEVFNKTNIRLNKDIIAMLNELNPSVDNRALIDNTQYWVFLSRVANTDLKLFYFLPSWDIKKDVSAFATYTIVAVALFMLLLIPLFLFISKSVTKPLKQLTASMEQFSHGDFASHVNFRYSDEVGRLGKVFNLMVRENKKLININYVLKLKEKEAELASLQAQINPHFLYNVVNSIQWLAVKNNDKEVADLVYSLGRIFRFNLGVKDRQSNVRQEIELLHNYLKLQKQCYGNRFTFSVNVEEGVEETYIPCLCIQPIVENSIIHGVESCPEKVTISVRVYLSPDGKLIHIDVSDNGPGIPPEILALLPDKYQPIDSEDKPRGNRMALKNISDRLRITYGDQYTFTISSIPYKETIVKIVLPVLYTTKSTSGGKK